MTQEHELTAVSDGIATNSASSNFELSADTIDSLFQQALSVKGASEFKQLIDQIVSIRRHKLWNAFLISVQRPGAIAIATPKEWRDHFQRTILPGARPIVILHPFGPVKFVYELADTTGPDHPRLRIHDPFGVSELGDRVFNLACLGELSKAFLEEEGILIQRDDLGSSYAGFATRVHGGGDGETLVGEGTPSSFVVRVDRRQQPAATFATLAHELGHIFCGHLGVPATPTKAQGKKYRPWWPSRSGELTHPQREFEAEATAYVVCQRLGIRTKSSEYLANLITSADWAKISVSNIVRAADRIERISRGVLEKFGDRVERPENKQPMFALHVSTQA